MAEEKRCKDCDALIRKADWFCWCCGEPIKRGIYWTRAEKDLVAKKTHCEQLEVQLEIAHYKTETTQEELDLLEKTLREIDWWKVLGGTCIHRDKAKIGYDAGIACKECCMHDCKLKIEEILKEED